MAMGKYLLERENVGITQGNPTGQTRRVKAIYSLARAGGKAATVNTALVGHVALVAPFLYDVLENIVAASG